MVLLRDPKRLAQKAARVLYQPALAILFGLLVGVIVIVASDENPFNVYGQMFEKSFFNFYYLMQTLTRAVPITVSSLAIIAAWRAGYINLGVEGQMIAGSFVSTVVALYVPGPVPLVFLLAVVCGLATGALVSLFSAYIHDRFNVSVVISTLMMNYVTRFITSYFVTFPLRAPDSDMALQSVQINEGMWLPRIFEDHTFNLGFIITLLLVAGVMFVTGKTNFGYESKMTGFNPLFARYGGVKRQKVMYSTMALSGALAATAGILEIFSLKYRFIDGMFTSTSYAWTGLMSGLISSLHPIGAFVTSIFLSGLQVGGQAIQRTTSIPLQVATIIQSTITLFVSVKLFSHWGKSRFKKRNDIDQTVKEGEQ